jgi:hypothetical protein
MQRQLACHGYFRDLSSSPHGQVEERAAPLRLTAHCDLGRFHQQIAQQLVARLPDTGESSPIAAGLF